MGKIKKLVENELVGGTTSTEIYPITSTKAVFNPNNKSLEDILNDRIQVIKETSEVVIN